MYKEYFRLNEEPFSITPDPKYLFLTEQHQEAMNHVLFGIRQRKGFICLTGEVGAGKTTICRSLLGQLGDTFHTALILNPVLTETQLIRAVLSEFGVECKCRDRLSALNTLNEFLLWINSAGKDAVVIIDEAQDMPDATLEMTRLLSNLETNTQKLLQILLVGQPELREKLDKPSFRQLAQRITVWFHLGNLTAHQTEQYLEHRLRVAGSAAGPGPVQPTICFDRGAVREIYRYSRGTPRLVNAISDKALLAGYVYRTHRIDRRLVQLAAAELKEAS